MTVVGGFWWVFHQSAWLQRTRRDPISYCKNLDVFLKRLSCHRKLSFGNFLNNNQPLIPKLYIQTAQFWLHSLSLVLFKAHMIHLSDRYWNTILELSVAAGMISDRKTTISNWIRKEYEFYIFCMCVWIHTMSSTCNPYMCWEVTAMSHRWKVKVKRSSPSQMYSGVKSRGLKQWL